MRIKLTELGGPVMSEAKLSEIELKEYEAQGYTRIKLGESDSSWNEITFEGEWPNSKTGSNITITERRLTI